MTDLTAIPAAKAALLFVFAVPNVLPVPLRNMLPALAISLLALGVLERDGLRILAGMVTAAASVAFFFREVL